MARLCWGEAPTVIHFHYAFGVTGGAMLLLYTPVYLATKLISSEFDIRSCLNQRHMCWNDMPQLKLSEYMVRHVLHAYMDIYPGSPERNTQRYHASAGVCRVRLQ